MNKQEKQRQALNEARATARANAREKAAATDKAATLASSVDKLIQDTGRLNEENAKLTTALQTTAKHSQELANQNNYLSNQLSGTSQELAKNRNAVADLLKMREGMADSLLRKRLETQVALLSIDQQLGVLGVELPTDTTFGLFGKKADEAFGTAYPVSLDGPRSLEPFLS